jgi:hypothetical protein
MPLYTFIHNLLNALVQIGNKKGIAQKKVNVVFENIQGVGADVGS